jgi:hypothetical protein
VFQLEDVFNAVASLFYCNIYLLIFNEILELLACFLSIRVCHFAGGRECLWSKGVLLRCWCLSLFCHSSLIEMLKILYDVVFFLVCEEGVTALSNHNN